MAGVRLTGYKIDSPASAAAATASRPGTSSSATRRRSMPLAIIDEHSSFSMRTSAAVCVAAKYLARRDASGRGSSASAILGDGPARARALFSIGEVRVISRTHAAASRAAKCKRGPGLAGAAVDSYEEVCRGADIIIAATPSTLPSSSTNG